MLLRIIIFGISIVCLAATRHPDTRPLQPVRCYRSLNDSTPPLHTIKTEEIDSLIPTFEGQILIVKLKSGVRYRYEHPDWDFEDVHFTLDNKIKEEIGHMQMTFTKVEHPPEFPGGEDSLAKYLAAFCQQHKKELKGKLPAELTLQFIVHMHGEVRYVQIIRSSGGSKVNELAIKAINDGPDWIPATQNGYTVLSYRKQTIILDLNK